MKNWIIKQFGYISCIVITSVIFLTFLLVQDIKHTSEKLLLQKEYIELLDANHQQSETNLRCIEIIKQRDATIKEIIERYNLLLKQLNGTAQWAIPPWEHGETHIALITDLDSKVSDS